MEKQEIRKLIRDLKHRYTDEELDAMSRDAIKHVMANASFQAAHTVLLYYSMHGEVGTHQLVDLLYRNGKVVLLPKVVDGEHMSLIAYTGRENMKPAGAFHILEPQGEPFTEYDKIDMAVIPGIAFTQNGKRMGRGRGYYDRLLAQMPNVRKIGLAFPFQILDDIPTSPFDIMMDEVVC